MKLPLNSSPSQSRQTREQFANPDTYLDYELGKAVQELPPLYTRLVRIILSAAVFGAIAWAGLSKVDEVAEAHGRLSLGGQEKPLRSLSRGEIKDINEIRVKEGQQVQKGDRLVELDSKSSLNDIERLKNKAILIRQDIQRVSKAGDWNQKSSIKQAEIELSGLQKELELRKKQANKLRSLAGAIPRIQVENAQQEVKDLETKIAVKQQEIKRLPSNYQTGLSSDISKRREELQSVERELEQAKNQRKNQIITAPISGKVYNIKVNRGQGTVESGEELLSILPEGKDLLLEVDLPNQYKAFVHEKMQVKVKIDSLNYQEFGIIDGEVINVSPNAVIKDKDLSKPVYPTRIKLDPVMLKKRGLDKQLTAGMTAEGDIVMRRKSVLSLLLEPVTRKFDDVFSRK